jgi:hypothetical protein
MLILILLIYCRSRHSISLSDCFGSCFRKRANDNKKNSISVIVCAKNEEENVAKFIPLLWQDYPDFEIVLMMKCFSDNTLQLLKNLKSNIQCSFGKSSKQ